VQLYTFSNKKRESNNIPFNKQIQNRACSNFGTLAQFRTLDLELRFGADEGNLYSCYLDVELTSCVNTVGIHTKGFHEQGPLCVAHGKIDLVFYAFVCVPLSSSRRPLTIRMISVLSFSP